MPKVSNASRYIKYGRTKEAVRKQLVSCKLFGHNVWLHKKVVPQFKAWEQAVRDYENATIIFAGKKRKRVTRPWMPHRIDSWNWRLIRGSASRSLHSFGVALDIDPATNPQGKPLRTDIPWYVRSLAASHGITWGGSWKRRPDAMHFEYQG